MSNTHNYQLRVAQVSITAGIFALASIFFTAAGADFNTGVFTNPRLLLGMTTVNVQYLKWSMILDMFGFYLLLLPALFYFHQYLQARTAWSFLLSWCGSACILIGAMGAGILSVVLPAYITEYQIATAVQQEIIMRNFDLANQIVYGGMWNTVEVVLAGTWWVGLGIVLKKDQPVFGTVTIVSGAASLLDGFGNMAGLKPLAEIGLNMYLVLGIAWPIWFGIQLIVRSNLNYSKQRIKKETPELGFA
jgi:hypothetical protein